MAVSKKETVKTVDTRAAETKTAEGHKTEIAAGKAAPKAAKTAEPKTAKAAAPKTTAKAAEPAGAGKAAESKAAVKAAEPKAVVKTTAVSTKPAEKKNETVKKTPAAKKAEPKTSIVIEYAGNQIAANDILEAAKKAFTKANKGVEIKTMEVYVKPEEHVAYYVVNGEGSDDYKVGL